MEPKTCHYTQKYQSKIITFQHHIRAKSQKICHFPQHIKVKFYGKYQEHRQFRVLKNLKSHFSHSNQGKENRKYHYSPSYKSRGKAIVIQNGIGATNK